MGCLIVLMALIGPRVALGFTWLFTNLVDRAFDEWIVPLLGLIFLPWTTFLYVLVYNPVEGVSFLGWVFVVLGLLADLGSYGAGARTAARRRPLRTPDGASGRRGIERARHRRYDGLVIARAASAHDLVEGDERCVVTAVEHAKLGGFDAPSRAIGRARAGTPCRHAPCQMLTGTVIDPGSKPHGSA